MLKRKKLVAHVTCQLVLCFPVSRVAVLPMSAIAPVVPNITVSYGK